MLKNPLETGNHANATTNAPNAIAERDKSRPYAVPTNDVRLAPREI